MINPYSLERLIEERLKQELSDSVLVLRAANIQGIPRQYSQSVYVIPQALQVNEQRRGQVALAESVYVVAVIRNASTQLSSADSMDDAGPLMTSIVQALLGWVPADGYESLEMSNAPVPEFEAGFGYYPLAFTTRYILSGV